MVRSAWFSQLVAVACLCLMLAVPFACAEDAPKGRIPTGWGKVGLSVAQKQQIYKVQAEYRAKVTALQAQIDQLKAEQRQKELAVLTDAQRRSLGFIGQAEAKGK